jgi:membrane protease YdiL (CAAX protease family)
MTLIKNCAPFVPYIAVLLGLYVFKNAWLTLALYHAGIILILAHEKQLGHIHTLFKGGTIPMGILLSGFGLIAGLLFYFLWPTLGLQETLSNNMTSFQLTGISFYAWTLYFFLVNPFFEEIFWRGYLGSEKKWPVLNDFLFAGYHVLVLLFFIPLLWTIIAFVALSITSWFWRLVQNRYGGLLLPTISHLAGDLSVMAVCIGHM